MADDCDLYDDFDFGPAEVIGSGVGGAAKAGAAPRAEPDFDLYDDLEGTGAGSRAGGTGSGAAAGNDDDTEDSADYDAFGSSKKASHSGAGEDGEAMRALLEVLRAAGDDEAEGAAGTSGSGGGTGGAAPGGNGAAGGGGGGVVRGRDAAADGLEDFSLSADDLYAPSVPSAFKKPRLAQGGEDEPPLAVPPAPAAPADPDAEFDFEADLPPATAANDATLQTVPGHDRGQRQGDSDQRGGAGSSYWFNTASRRWESGPAPPGAEQLPPDGIGAATAEFVALGGGLDRVLGALDRGKGGAFGAWAGRGGKGKGKFGRGVGKGFGRGMPPNEKLKSTICRHFMTGSCKWGEQCYFAHGEADLQGAVRETLNRRYVFQVMIEATNDEKKGLCDKTQALAVRLALKFEERPEDILTCMAQAGLPAGADQRTTVKALLRLCHPDKCRHPEAKKAVQILGPLLGRAGN